MNFDDLSFEPHPAGLGGVRAVAKFANGYGASVVQAPFSYGGDSGLYEFAVIAAPDWTITYETPITDDVIGYLSEDGVNDLLQKIAALAAARAAKGGEA